MSSEEKQIAYTTANTYSTMNTLNEKTRNVWIVLHGIGFLSRYFIQYFSGLPKEDNYIIAPQAPSKYYLKMDFKRVGASWLTRENTALETTNVLNYLDSLLAAEKIPAHCRLLVLGFSQGVSIAARWAAKSKLELDQLILYAGGIPEELTAEDFKFLQGGKAKVTLVVGNQDQFITKARLEHEKEKMDFLFKGKAELIKFEGGHEINREVLNRLLI